MTKELDNMIDRLEKAADRLQAVAQGRVYVVGTKVIYNNKFGVVTNLKQGAEDPLASTIDLRLDDGTVAEDVKVSSASLELFRQ